MKDLKQESERKINYYKRQNEILKDKLEDIGIT